MVKVCDAIMGTGKSSAAITYINEHVGEKFIYVTPYLDEADRIARRCEAAHFVRPSNKLKEYGYSKIRHTCKLIEDGRNIASTHSAFMNYTPDVIDMIRAQGYTLIIDENIDILDKLEFNGDDLQLLVNAGYVHEEGGAFTMARNDYGGKAFRDFFRLLECRKLIKVGGAGKEDLFYWILPPDFFKAFKDVFVLTYMFEGQSVYNLFKIHDIQFTYIGIEHDGDNYRFTDVPSYTPDYVYHLRDMIDVYDGPMNDVGQSFHALSKAWFERSDNVKVVTQLKNNVYNYFRHKVPDAAADERLWSTYGFAKSKVSGAGYSRKGAFAPLNARAENKYKDRIAMAYAVNVFANVGEKLFYRANGIEMDESAYATSVMVQWIWRSAIREGQKIHIYLPSRRMRELLSNWMDNVQSYSMPGYTPPRVGIE